MSASPAVAARAPASHAPFRSAARTHPGLVRRNNEDSLLDFPEAGLWAVADGMGGHRQGEVASALIVEALGRLDVCGSPYGALRAVCDAIQAVNRRLVTLAAGSMIGSTVVALLINDGHFACVWAGDSRAYLQRDGVLQPLTRDHSIVQALVDAGSLSPLEARAHRQAHVLTRAVGHAEVLVLDMHRGPVLPGDRFLLCSDGLTGLVADPEIQAVLAEPDIDAASDRLLHLAMARGGRDNVTTVIVAAA